MLEVLDVIHHTFTKLLNWEKELMQAFMDNGDINSLINASLGLFENSITVYDNSLRLIGSGSHEKELLDFYWVKVSDEKYLSPKDLEASKDFHKLDNGKKIDNPMIVPSPYCDIMVAPIFIREKIFGYLHIHIREKKINDSYLFLAEMLASYISKVLQEKILRETMPNRLPIEYIVGSKNDPTVLNHYKKMISDQKSELFQVLLFSSAIQADIAEDHPHIIYIINTLFRYSYTVAHENSVIVILYHEVLSGMDKYRFDAFCRFVYGEKLRVGCSLEFTDFTKLPEYYRQASVAIEVSDKQISYYRGNLSKHMELVFSEHLPAKEYLADEIRLLKKKDRTGILTSTIFIYLLCDRSYSRTAEAVNIHKSTLKYRHDKIYDIVPEECFIDPKRRIDILLSLEMLIDKEAGE